MARFLARMVGFARFDIDVYEEVEADTHATLQALVVVLLACLGAGIGWSGAVPQQGSALLLLTIVAIGGWVMWAVLTYLIGTRLLAEPQTRADVGQLLRTLGFAQSPGVLQVVGAIPGVNPVGVTLLLAVWWLATTVVAVRQALDLTSTARAFAVCITGWALALVMFFVIGIFYAQTVS
jgi:hypothetical protein